ncbi:phosphopantetheine-binding protein [Mesoterricola silvestris]|uniref:Acyl carrier protein n=1 Tax=Mesoterricola silvestris TaxID=2927979 RepID=A0AA48GP78_9BACT|nr:phosphopantetheine-binding protein [Mesoterricola silvestris]BDU71462.1 acyl carrier protein [Mesoterricola silvestris]
MAPTPLELKAFIIETLDLEDLRPGDIGDDQPLFRGGLGLDSVDALELAMALKRRYGASVEAAGAFQERLGTVRALARWLAGDGTN